MIRTLAKQIKEFKLASILTPLCMIGEVIAEMIIPLLVASIVDNGIMAGDIRAVVNTGLEMVLISLIGLFFGCMGARFGAFPTLTNTARRALLPALPPISPMCRWPI